MVVVFLHSVATNVDVLGFATFFQVYNEQIRDLLKPDGFLPIREDPEKGVTISGLSLHKVCSICGRFTQTRISLSSCVL